MPNAIFRGQSRVGGPLAPGQRHGLRVGVSCLMALFGLALIGEFFSISTQAATRHYTYDGLNRLVAVQYEDGTVAAYVYDNAGNRLIQSVTLASTPAGSPPGAPSGPTISDGAADVSTTPGALSWAASTEPAGGNVIYYLFFGTSNNPPLVFSGWQTNWSPGHLSGFTTYYWYVVACDSHNNLTLSPLWSFTTGDDPPQAAFITYSTSGWAPLTVSFYDRSVSLDDTIASWQWDFNGDGIVDSTDQNPAWTYNNAGNFDVTLTVADTHGVTSTVTQRAVVHVLDQTVLDLAPTSLALDGMAPYKHIGVIYSVTNQGALAINVPCEWDDGFYVSTNAVLDVMDGSAQFVTSFHESTTLLPGSHYTRTNVLALPVGVDGHYHLFLKVDVWNVIPEINEDNNVASVPLNLPAPNLVPVTLTPPTPVLSGQLAQLAWRVANRGSATALGPWEDEVFISTNSFWDWTAQSLGKFEYDPNLSAGADYWATNQVQLPRLAPGTYYLLLTADTDDWVFETDESDNTLPLAVSVVLGPQPDLAPLKILAPNPLLSGQTVQLAWCVTNQGTAMPAVRWSDELYLSTNSVWDLSSVVSFVGEFDEDPNLPPGTSYWTTNQVQLDRITPGNYYLLLYTDAEDDLFELNEDNNVLAVPVSVQLGLQPDLVPVQVSLPMPLLSGQTMQMVFTVTNQGVGPANGSWTDAVFLSTNAVYDESGIVLAMDTEDMSVGAGTSYQVTNQVQLPRLDPGGYYLYAVADVFDEVFESNENNNVLSLPVNVILGAQPDLAPLLVFAPAALNPMKFTNLVWGVTNQGTGVAQAPWYDGVYFSSNSFWDTTAVALAANFQQTNLPPGGSYLLTNTIIGPSVSPGVYYLFVVCDSGDQVYESAEDNNVISTPIVVEAPPNTPDLSPVSLNAPAFAQPGQSIQISYTVTNLTSVPATGMWLDILGLSANPVWDDSATYLAMKFMYTPLAGNGSYSVTTNLTLPPTDSGSYYLILYVNGMGLLTEANLNNDTLATPIQIGGTPTFPDLAPISITAPSQAAPGQPFQVICVITNQGNESATGLWTDQLVLATNASWSPDAYSMAIHQQMLAVEPAQTYAFTNSISLPVWSAGQYYLVLQADVAGTLTESSQANNTLAVPIVCQTIRLGGFHYRAGGGFQLAVSGIIGDDYTLWSSTNLLSWQRVLDFTCTNNPTALVDAGATGARGRFYRVTAH